jgi:hypothetical protein
VRGASIRWRRVDRAGHDTARLTESVAPVVDGTAVFVEQGRGCRLDYRVACDAAWRTVSANVTGRFGDRAVAIDVMVDAGRRWLLNGVECADVQGCDDVDLSFSPVTNLLPIRRLNLAIGERAAVRAAWLSFPACTLEPLDQVYERRYESNGGAFVAMLQVNALGFVTNYPGLWREEGAA